MNYFDGIEFFLVLAIALIIGFIINYLGKKIEYYILVLSVIFAALIYGKSITMLSYLVGFILFEYILVLIAQKTESKKSLETYVQGYYLDLILEAGTKRLLQMTDERYRFERKIEKAKGGGLQGLDIEIYDVYLNSSRVVSSLSGGEIFLASLSLALGLAEVIQNESGGISLETIFIDEGFGSLDAETLDTAITTLIELQSYGRNIGIISHVSELKERIRPKLEVYSKNNYAKVKISGV